MTATADRDPLLAASYRRCAQLTRAHGTTYYWSTRLLPSADQPHVFALYAVCRTRLEANFVPGFVQVLAQIPKTASEKPQDRFLVEAFEASPDSVHRPASAVR